MTRLTTCRAAAGPWGTVWVDGHWQLNPRHGLRVVLAPFDYSENGTLAHDVSFVGAT